MRKTVSHTFPPFIPKDAVILILGTMPSPRSRHIGFYYGHPQNRFWKALAGVFDEAAPVTVDEQKSLLTRHKIALWDTLASCEIDGADDSSIRHPVPNDIATVLKQYPIRAVFTTGTKATEFYRRLIQPETGIEALPLPSPSPANCRYYTLETLTEAYRIIRNYTEL